jgi:hypothetical protein
MLKNKINLPTIIIVGAIVGFATIMYKFNTGTVNDIFEHPTKGDIYVMRNFPEAEAGELLFRISTVSKDSITFQVPNSKLINGFDINKSESFVKINSNSIFSTDELSVSRKELVKMKENDGLTGNMEKKPLIYYVFR